MMTSPQLPRSQPAQLQLVHQWADLLELLLQGVEAVATSAEDMARELPRELVSSVNRELRQRGSSFQVPGRRLRTAAGPRHGGMRGQEARATAARRCG